MRALVASLLLLCFSLLQLACREEVQREGAAWQAPAYESMPPAFSAAELQKLPNYVASWRAPEGFQGFVERWNRRVHEWLQVNIEKTQEQLAALSPEQGGRRASLEQHLAELMHRLELGAYLCFKDRFDLPSGLEWQDGAEQPELGSAQAKKGGTLRLALPRSFPNTLRPFGPNSNNSTRRYLYDDVDLPLVRIHPSTGKMIPGTAKRWAVSEDGKTVFFELDENARFSDGSPLRVQDFITSLFVRSSEYSVEAFYASFYLEKFAQITLYGPRIIAVTLPSARPYAPFYANIPFSHTAFYAEFGPDYSTRYQWRVPPGTGGYCFDAEGLIMGRQLRMKRVKNWWAAERPFTKYSCNVDYIHYSFINEASKLRELFRVGEIDMYSTREVNDWYEGLEIPEVHKGYIERVQFAKYWPCNSFGFHLNCTQAPLDHIDLRRGLQYALNVQEVINTTYRGDYTRMGSYFMGFGPYTNEAIKAAEFSPARAREYFSAAGYTEEGSDGILCKPDGQRLQLTLSSRIDPLYSNFIPLLRKEAARCGLDLQFEMMDDTIFFLKVRDKQLQAFIFSWGFAPPLPTTEQYFLSQYAFANDGTPATGTDNVTGIADAELDAAILAANSARSEEAAQLAHHRVQSLIDEAACWVPGWTTTFWRFAQWRWVCWPDTPETRFCPPRYYDPFDSHLYWLDEEIREETLRARSKGVSFPEIERNIPLPPA